MTFFPLPDEFYADPQFLSATPAAVDLWIRAGSWSAHHLTDGLVPFTVLPVLRQIDTTAADELVELRIWKRARGGYRFVYWPKLASKAYVEAKREAARTRQEKARRSKGVTSRRDSRVNHTGGHKGSHSESHASQSSPSLSFGERDGLLTQSDATSAAQAKALAIANCLLCDDDGYHGRVVCDHDPESAARAVRAAVDGMAAVRAQLSGRQNGHALEPSAVAADAVERARARDRKAALDGFLAHRPDGGEA